MADYGPFKYGVVTYPIPTDGTELGGVGATLLRDADPALFYTIEFYKSIIETYVGPRLLQEATAAGFTTITQPVGDWLPLNPEHFLLEDQIRFPLLAAYRKGSKSEWIGSWKLNVSEVEVVYVLPPMTSAEGEKLLPALRAIEKLIDNKTNQGSDPNYTPSAPTGTPGEPFWTRAGLTSCGFKSARYGSFATDASLYFPALTMTIELKERNEYALATLDTLTGADVAVDLAQETQPTYVDLVDFKVDGKLSLTSSTPSSGTKQGGTSVTITGANFDVGTQPVVYFDNIPATNVVVVNSTTITCKTPPHDAYPTAMADIYIVDRTGQSSVLVTAFTYTTP